MSRFTALAALALVAASAVVVGGASGVRSGQPRWVIPALANGNSQALGISDNGQIVGWSDTENGVVGHAVLWTLRSG